MQRRNHLTIFTVLVLACMCLANTAAVVRNVEDTGAAAHQLLNHSIVRLGCYYDYYGSQSCDWSGVAGIGLAALLLLCFFIIVSIILRRRQRRDAQNAGSMPAPDGKSDNNATAGATFEQSGADANLTPAMQAPNAHSAQFQPSYPQQYQQAHAQPGYVYPSPAYLSQQYPSHQYPAVAYIPHAYPPRMYPPHAYPLQGYPVPPTSEQMTPTGVESPPASNAGVDIPSVSGSASKPSGNINAAQESIVPPSPEQAPPTSSSTVPPPAQTPSAHTSNVHAAASMPSSRNPTAALADVPDAVNPPVHVHGSVIDQTDAPKQPR